MTIDDVSVVTVPVAGSLRPELEAAFLDLERLSMEPNDAFLFRDPAPRRHARDLLWTNACADFSSPHGLIATAGGSVVGMGAGAPREELAGVRLRASMLLHRSSLVRDDPDLPRRLRRAAASAAPLLAGDFHWSRFAVDPRARRRGIGRRLARELERRARAAGCRRLVAEVAFEHAPARELMESEGLEVIGEARVDDPERGAGLGMWHLAKRL